VSGDVKKEVKAIIKDTFAGLQLGANTAYEMNQKKNEGK